MFGVSSHGQQDADGRIGGTFTAAVLEERRNRCFEELRAAADVPAFESRGIDAFRRGLRAGIGAVLSVSRDAFWAKECGDGGGASGDGRANAAVPSSSSFVRYDGETIETCLSPRKGGINWSGLILDHDAVCSRRSASGASRSTPCAPKNEERDAPQRTALDELLDALLDPTLIPPACVGSVFMVLVRAYVEGGAPSSARSDGSALQPPAAAASNGGGIEGRYPNSSTEHLQRSMSRLLRRSPLLSPADLLGPYLHSKLRINLPPSVHRGTGKESSDALNLAVHQYDVNAAHRVLSLIKFFVEGSERRRMEVCAMRAIVGCIMDIDNLDVWLMKIRDRSAGRGCSVREGRRRRGPSGGGGFKALCCSRCRLSGSAGRERCDDAERREASSRRKAKTIGISDLHDMAPQGQEDEDECGISIESMDYADGRRTERVSLSRQFQQPALINRVSMKKVMSAAPSNMTDTGPMTSQCPCLCYTDSSMPPSTAKNSTNSRQLRCSLLPLKMVQLRSDLYRAILSVAMQQWALPRGEDLCRTDSSTLSLLSRQRHYSDAPIFHLVMKMMHRYSLCAAARLCAVLVADARGIEKGYLPLMKTIWDVSISSLLPESSSLSDRDRERCENSLRAYSELIVELAVFDGPDKFWEVMKPLLDCVLDLCRGNQEDEDPLTPEKDIGEGGKSLVDSWQTKEYRVKLLLRAVSYVLVHRRNTLSSVDSTKVQNSVTQLSLYCSEEDLWISRSMPPAERIEVTRTLQALGVLSFIDEADMKRNDETVADEAAARIYEDYPFTPSSSLRDAVGRMGPKVGCNRFLSSRNVRQTMLESNPKERPRKRRREDSLSESLPLLEYLNDDTIRTIFSFLGYRRLARVTGTCKLWNALGNERGFWRRHYLSRFKPLLDKDIVSKLTPSPPPHISASIIGEMEEGMDWRKLFDAKWAAERSLRSSFSRCGTWRHRTCGVVGCLSVLKSRAQYEKHVNKHRNDLAKKIDRQIAAEERKKKREKDRAAREERRAEEKLARKNMATK